MCYNQKLIPPFKTMTAPISQFAFNIQMKGLAEKYVDNILAQAAREFGVEEKKK